jgi:S-adenosylmethionine hydrolase
LKPILVYQTDFTYKEGAISAMYGVVKSVDRELEIIDGTHEIPKFDTWSASYRLYQSMPFWPQGTIFVSVVDPGVGTNRRACVARTTNGYLIVTPDNGSLTHVKRAFGIDEIREIDETINRLRGMNTDDVSVFHGRDVFSYCAARLASGIITFEEVGQVYNPDEVVMHPIHEPFFKAGFAKGIFEINDPNFGNNWTNLPLKSFLNAGFAYGDRLQVTIFHQGQEVYAHKLLFERSFGYAKTGEAILYNNELMRVSIAVNQGSFVEQFGIGYGPEWQVEISK